MEVKNNIAYFETDDELTDYVMDINPTFYHDDKSGLNYYDYKFTDAYQDLLNNNIKITVIDKNSKVMKRKHVNRGLISKKLSNLCEWY